MTQENTPEHGKVLPDDFARTVDFFNEKKIQTECPACGAASWEIIGAESETSIGLTIKREGRVEESIIPLVVALCLNCGYARMHSKSIMDEVNTEARSPRSDKK